MKFAVSLIITILLLTNSLPAQYCGSNATSADALREKERSRTNENQRVSISPDTLHFALKFHILTETDSSGAPDYSFVKSSFDTLNKTFAKINVVFDTCSGSSYIHDGRFFNFDDSTQENQIASLYDTANVINVYIVNTLWYGKTQICGVVSQIYSSLSTNRLFVAQQCLPYITLTHEMGHYFGLYHTFEKFWGIEDPKESNCTIAGDLVCDTPSDPEGSVNNLCQYLGPYTINYYGNNEAVHPLVDNIMSYYDVYGRECRTSFTQGQHDRMTSWALANKGLYPCPPPYVPPAPVLTIDMYPVPAANLLTVSIAHASFPLNFRIVDMTGKVVYKDVFTSNSAQVDLTHLAFGMYIAQVTDSNNKSLFLKKIIKISDQ